MISSPSSIRSTCSDTGGQIAASGDSFSDSPEPIPRNGRPGNIRSKVAQAWAISTG